MAAVLPEDVSRLYDHYNMTRGHVNAAHTDAMEQQLEKELGLGNISFEEYVRIVAESRAQLYWFTPAVEIPLIVLYATIIMFGLFANGLICWVILKKKSLRTVRNLFILNLAVADILMCIFCMPFTLLKLLMKSWPLGEAVCRLVPWLQAVNVCASVLTITAISLDRYQVIVFPSAMRDHMKRWVAGGVLLMIWVVSMALGMPLMMYSRVETKEEIRFVSFNMCLEDWPSAASRSMYASITLVIQFALPITVLVVIHWRICSFLKCRIHDNPVTPMEMKRAMKQAKRHRKNSTLLMAIAIMFALCWFPLTLLNLLADLKYSIFMFKNFLFSFAIAHLVAMTSACLNPIMYGWFNSNFRHEFTSVVCFWRVPQHYSAEQRKLMREAARPQDQRIVYTRRMSYKAIQTEVQPVIEMVSTDVVKIGSSED